MLDGWSLPVACATGCDGGALGCSCCCARTPAHKKVVSPQSARCSLIVSATLILVTYSLCVSALTRRSIHLKSADAGYYNCVIPFLTSVRCAFHCISR